MIRLQHYVFILTWCVTIGTVVVGALRCPTLPPNTFGTCVEACNDITNPCPSTQLCCSNGCGHVCKDPVVENNDDSDDNNDTDSEDNSQQQIPDAGEVIPNDNDSSVCDYNPGGDCWSEESYLQCISLEQIGCASTDIIMTRSCPPQYSCLDKTITYNNNSRQQPNSDSDEEEEIIPVLDTVCEYNPNGTCWSQESYDQCTLLEEQGGCFGNDIIIAKSCPPQYKCRKTLFIYPEKVDCVGAAPQLCYLVKFDDPGNMWQNFYGSIVDFDSIWEEGYEYEILVSIVPIDNPPADSSSIRYLLMDVIHKSETKMYMPGLPDNTTSVCDPIEGNDCVNKNNHEYCLLLEENGCSTSKEIQIEESCPIQYTCTKTMHVAPEMADCVKNGLYSEQCYQIKFNDDDEWQFTYNDVVGFDWYEGIQYKLIVFVQPFIYDPPPAAGEPTVQYEVIQVVEKIEEIPYSACTKPDHCSTKESYDYCVLLEDVGCTGGNVIATTSCPPIYRCNRLIYVWHEQVPCEEDDVDGRYGMCYIIKFDYEENPEWEYLLPVNDLIGFEDTWEEGNQYELFVSVQPTANPDINNADKPLVQYAVIEVTDIIPVSPACGPPNPGSDCFNVTSYEYCLDLERIADCTESNMQITKSCPPKYSCTKQMFIASEKVACEGGAGPQLCYQVKFDNYDDNEWELFYGEIDGFKWEEGYEYELIVGVIVNQNPIPDQSSINYVLLQEVDKVEKKIIVDDDCPSGFGVRYVANSTEVCSRIKFVCDIGLEPFFGPGDCGCGCKPIFCGGIAGVKCPVGSICIDDPNDDCDLTAGADCGGICQPGNTMDDVCSTIPCSADRECTQINGCGRYTCDKRFNPGVEGYEGTCSLAAANYAVAKCQKFIPRGNKGGLRWSKC